MFDITVIASVAAAILLADGIKCLLKFLFYAYLAYWGIHKIEEMETKI